MGGCEEEWWWEEGVGDGEWKTKGGFEVVLWREGRM